MTEVVCIMGFYRLIFALIVSFFIDSWIVVVGVGWVFDIAAFLFIGLFPYIISLMWKGPRSPAAYHFWSELE